jgi:predicted CXXCH cytochrome family protein
MSGRHASTSRMLWDYCSGMGHILLVWTVIVITFPAVAQIQGSAHDFSAQGWSGGELCSVCHVPHAVKTTTSEPPLWNHTMSTTVYRLYSSSTLTQTPEQPASMNVSRLCLSCHDGTIALDSFGGSLGQNYIPDHVSLGTDLSDDHPIGVRSVLQNGVGGTGMSDGVKLFDSKVECPSCHDVHNNHVADKKLLRVSRAGSELCFQCHDK